MESLYDNTENGGGKLLKGEKVEKEFSEEEFLRDVYIKLAVNTAAPRDILLSSEFSKVHEREASCIIADMHVEIDYSCRIGTNREEEYVGVENSCENGVERQHIVEKVRNVTDWAPYSGSISSDEIVMVRNNKIVYNQPTDRIYNGNDYLSEVLMNCNKKHIHDTEEPVETSEKTVEEAKNSAIDKCYARVVFPGDFRDGETKKSKVEIKRISGLLLPEYHLEYRYKDKTYSASSYACGVLSSVVQFPKENEYQKANKIISEKTRPLTFITVGLFLIAVVLSVLRPFVPQIGKWYILPYVSGFLTGIFNWFILRGIMHDKLMNEQKTRKLEELKTILAGSNMQPLTQSEIKLFNIKKIQGE